MPRRKGKRPSIDGFTIAVAFPREKPLSVAVYEKARREQRLGDFERAPHPCANCGARTLYDVYFHDVANRRRAVGCPACMPSARQCARCQADWPLADFGINPSRQSAFKLESYCNTCRRARGITYYFAKRKPSPDAPARVRCNRCNRVRSRRWFFEDGRYRAGVIQPCTTCRAASERAYYATPEGKAARDAANARWRDRTTGPRKAGKRRGSDAG